jgi:hypothetical protein
MEIPLQNLNWWSIYPYFQNKPTIQFNFSKIWQLLQWDGNETTEQFEVLNLHNILHPSQFLVQTFTAINVLLQHSIWQKVRQKGREKL